MKTTAAALLALALCGCNLLDKKAAPAAAPGVLDGVGAARVEAEGERAKREAAEAEQRRLEAARDSRVVASANVIRGTNKLNPEGAPKVIVDGEAGRIQTEMGVQASAADDAAARARAAEAEKLVQAGRADEARANYDKSQEEVKKNAQELGAAKQAVAEADKRVADAEAKVSKALSDADAAIERNRKSNQAALDALNRRVADLQDGVARQTQFWLTMGCYGLAVLCVIAAGLLTYFGLQAGPIGFAGTAKRAGLPAFFAVIFFALGRFTSQPWFWWTVGITTVLALVALVAVFFLDARKTKAAVAGRAEAQGVGDDIITAIHDIREALDNPPVEVVRRVQEAKDIGEATSVIRDSVKSLFDRKLAEYVTERDGTAAYVDQRRRALGLVG